MLTIFIGNPGAGDLCRFAIYVDNDNFYLAGFATKENIVEYQKKNPANIQLVMPNDPESISEAEEGLLKDIKKAIEGDDNIKPL